MQSARLRISRPLPISLSPSKTKAVSREVIATLQLVHRRDRAGRVMALEARASAPFGGHHSALPVIRSSLVWNVVCREVSLRPAPGLRPFSSPSLVPAHVSFLPLFVSVYDLRSFLVVLMFMDDNLLSLLLLVFMLLKFIILRSGGGKVLLLSFEVVRLGLAAWNALSQVGQRGHPSEWRGH